MFGDAERMVIFFIGRCRRDQQEDGKLVAVGGETGPDAQWFASRCFADQSVRVHIDSPNRRFVRRLVTTLRVRNVQLES